MMKLTAVITPEPLSTGETAYVSLCPELDVASQGDNRDEALANLKEAIELLIEIGGKSEIERRLRANRGMISTFEVQINSAPVVAQVA